MRKLAKILKNKKGFTLVEAIAVVAIMGILATVIGGLVTAGTTAYMRQKENAAAKDLGTIVQNEIKRAARSSVEVYLQDENDNLPSADNEIADEGKTYTMKNAPTKEHSVFFSKNGKLFYAKGNEEPQEYFTDPKREAEGRAFTAVSRLRFISRRSSTLLMRLRPSRCFAMFLTPKGKKIRLPGA